MTCWNCNPAPPPPSWRRPREEPKPMPTIHLTDDEHTVLVNVFAQHWTKAELSRLTAETTLPRSPMLDTLFEKITGRPPQDIPLNLIFEASGGEAEMAEIRAGAFVLKVAHGLPTEETPNAPPPT